MNNELLGGGGGGLLSTGHPWERHTFQLAISVHFYEPSAVINISINDYC